MQLAASKKTDMGPCSFAPQPFDCFAKINFFVYTISHSKRVVNTFFQKNSVFFNFLVKNSLKKPKQSIFPRFLCKKRHAKNRDVTCYSIGLFHCFHVMEPFLTGSKKVRFERIIPDFSEKDKFFQKEKKMSKKGENIYKRKDGRWEARYARAKEPGGKLRYAYCYGKTYAEVKEKLRATLRAQPERRTALPPTRFGACCEEFLREKALSLKPASVAKYDQMIRRYLLPAFGAAAPQAIGSREFLAFSEQLTGSGLSAKTVRDVLTLLREVICSCYDRAFAEAPKMKCVFPKEDKKEMRVLSPEEQGRFVAYLGEPLDRYRVAVLLSLYTGMRIGEVCALRVGDVSFAEGVIRVRQTVQRLRVPGEENTRMLFGTPKSDHSARIIPLTEKAAALCGEWVRGEPEAFFLTGSPNEWVEPRILQYHFGKYAGACGLEGIHFHVLRHTFATRCVEVGVEIKSLSEILGHSSPRVTLERYVHSSLSLKKESMRKLSAVGM